MNGRFQSLFSAPQYLLYYLLQILDFRKFCLLLFHDASAAYFKVPIR